MISCFRGADTAGIKATNNKAKMLWLPDLNRNGEVEILEQYRRAGLPFHHDRSIVGCMQVGICTVLVVAQLAFTAPFVEELVPRINSHLDLQVLKESQKQEKKSCSSQKLQKISLRMGLCIFQAK